MEIHAYNDLTENYPWAAAVMISNVEGNYYATINDMVEWCNSTFGTKMDRCDTTQSSWGEFWFKEEEDLMLFLMRWR